jgi:hypothetical protein
MKTEVYEGGVRSPLWIRWPARFDAPRAVEPWAAHIDILPTVAEMCGVALPADLCCDGRSLLPLMQDPAAAWPSRYLVVQSHRGDVPVRYHHFMIRDDRWKLVHPSGFGKERFSGPPRFELYDLKEDVGETRNLASQRGEIVARLKTEYDRWFDDVSSTRPDNYEPPRIVIGSAREPVTVLTRQDWRRQGPPGTNRGIWHVNFQESGAFDFLVDCGSEPDVPVLTIADRIVGATDFSSREGETAEKRDRTRFVFRGIDVPKGPVNLSCRMQNSGQGAYQMTVRPSTGNR